MFPCSLGPGQIESAPHESGHTLLQGPLSAAARATASRANQSAHGSIRQDLISIYCNKGTKCAPSHAAAQTHGVADKAPPCPRLAPSSACNASAVHSGSALACNGRFSAAAPDLACKHRRRRRAAPQHRGRRASGGRSRSAAAERWAAAGPRGAALLGRTEGRSVRSATCSFRTADSESFVLLVS